MLKLDLTPPSGEGTILNRARHKNLVWVGRHCHLGEKLHQPGFQLGHQGTSGVWLLLGNMMYIVQILHCKNANIIDYVVSARDSRRMEHMYIYSKKHKVGSIITSRRLCFFSLTTTTRNVPLWTSLKAGSSWNNLRKVDFLLANNNNNKKCTIENKVSTWKLPLADCASPQGHSAHCTTGVHMPSPAAEMKCTLIGTPSKTT